MNYTTNKTKAIQQVAAKSSFIFLFRAKGLMLRKQMGL
jgi:hypothetical protein